MAIAVDQGTHGFKPLGRPPRCKLQSCTQFDYEMLQCSQSNIAAHSLNHPFEFTNIHKSFSTPCLSHSYRVKDDSDAISRIEVLVGHGAPRVRAMVVEVAIAVASGVHPEPASSGLGGAYFLRARNGNTIAVAKPIDEEPLALNNPKGFAGRMLGQPGLKSSIRIGETGLRESAAYLLDHDGFAGVPPTALVKFSHVKFHTNNSGSDSIPPSKIASLQRFVSHDSDAGDVGPSSFSVTSVHHIGILDVRLLNLDRHAGNILVKQAQESYGGGKAELVPIDHGFCLPESLDDPYFEWLHWPQASIPFSESEINYISNLDPFKDAELLRTKLPSLRESSIRVLMLCTVFLKQAASYGLCLSDIGEMMTREFQGGEENWSSLENLCLNAKASMNSWLSDDDVDDNVESSDDQDEYQEADEMFQLDGECENDNIKKVSLEVLPHIIQNSPSKGKPSKIPRFSSMTVLFPLDDNVTSLLRDCDSTNIWDDRAEGDADDNPKASVLTRSLSFPAPNHNHDGQGISFEEMDEEEWRLFLESFQKLLPHAFEERKSMGLSKQRLGSSCEF